VGRARRVVRRRCDRRTRTPMGASTSHDAPAGATSPPAFQCVRSKLAQLHGRQGNLRDRHVNVELWTTNLFVSPAFCSNCISSIRCAAECYVVPSFCDDDILWQWRSLLSPISFKRQAREASEAQEPQDVDGDGMEEAHRARRA